LSELGHTTDGAWHLCVIGASMTTAYARAPWNTGGIGGARLANGHRMDHRWDERIRQDREGRPRRERYGAPRIEPEIVFSWKKPITTVGLDAATVLADHVEWIALGFEIIDCPFPDWKFQPADFVASMGLHRALIVGDPMRCKQLTDRLLAEGIYVQPINYPTVARGDERIRLTPGPFHTPDLIAPLVDALARPWPEMGLRKVA